MKSKTLDQLFQRFATLAHKRRNVEQEKEYQEIKTELNRRKDESN